MTFTEFRKHHDAFSDAKNDIDWPRLMTLLDQGDTLAAGQYLDKHFQECADALSEELNLGDERREQEDRDRRSLEAHEARAINQPTRTY